MVGAVSLVNYPVNLALSPLAFALAAGNRVVVKLSEYTPAVNQVLKTLLSSELKRYVAFIEGDAQVGPRLAPSLGITLCLLALVNRQKGNAQRC